MVWGILIVIGILALVGWILWRKDRRKTKSKKGQTKTTSALLGAGGGAIITAVTILSFGSPTVIDDGSLHLSELCSNVTTFEEQSTPIYGNVTTCYATSTLDIGTGKNITGEDYCYDVQDVISYKNETVPVEGKACVDYAVIDGAAKPLVDTDYSCTQNGAAIECDNRFDGNADGKCQSGETCCHITENGDLLCDNGKQAVMPDRRMRI